MMSETRKAQNRQARAILGCYKHTIETAHKIEKVLREFDGKVLNCRLEEALRKGTGLSIYIKRNRLLCETASIEIYYQKFYDVSILKSLYIGPIKLQENKRINADEWIEALNKFIEDLKQRYDEILKTIGRIDTEILPDLKRIENELKELEASIPTECKEIWHLYRYIN